MPLNPQQLDCADSAYPCGIRCKQHSLIPHGQANRLELRRSGPRGTTPLNKPVLYQLQNTFNPYSNANDDLIAVINAAPNCRITFDDGGVIRGELDLSGDAAFAAARQTVYPIYCTQDSLGGW